MDPRSEEGERKGMSRYCDYLEEKIATLDASRFSRDELDLMRQWFDHMADVDHKYVEQKDRDLYAKIKAQLNAR